MALTVAISMVAVACVQGFTGTELRSNVPKAAAAPADVRAIAPVVAGLGADTLRVLAATEAGNVAVSPSALAVQVSMVATGAATSSAAALDALLGGTGLTTATEGRTTIDGAVSVPTSRSGTARSPRRSGPVAVETAIALWIQRGPTVAEGFLDDLATAHGTGIRQLDFRSDPEGARAAVNLWTSGTTDGAITLVAPGGSVTSGTRLLSTAAQSVTAPWLVPFRPEATTPAAFTTAGGEVLSVPTMVLTAPLGLRWGSGADWQAVGLPLLGRQLMVVVALADPGTPPLTERLDATLVTTMIDELRPRPLTIRLPRFTLDVAASLTDPLKLGAGVVFDTDLADLTVAAPAERLALTDVLQAVRLSLDEEGSGGRAATVDAPETAAPTPSLDVAVDRPFFLMVVDLPTRIPLLMAEINDPTG